LGEEHGDTLIIADPRVVAVSLVSDVRRRQGEQAVVAQRAAERLEPDPLQQHLALGVAHHRLLDPVPALGARIR
jgi:hypothetical protein